jgi:Tol biopolymer transport system component
LESRETHDVPLPNDILKSFLIENVSWFPDSQKLLLESKSETQGHSLWLSSVFGGTPQLIKANASAASVSPQGTAIAYATNQGQELWTSGRNGQDARRIFASDGEIIARTSWSPSGKQLACLSRARGGYNLGGFIYTVPQTGGSSRQVYASNGLRADGAGALLWTADDRIIFSEDRSSPYYSVNLYALRVDKDTGVESGKSIQLTNWFRMVPWYATITHDGSRLALTKADDWHDVYIADLQNGGKTLASPRPLGLGRSINYPTAWTKDGSWVYFDSTRNGTDQIFRQRLDRDTPDLVQGSAKYDVGGATLTPDDKWVLFVSRDPDLQPTDKPKLMRVPVGGGSAELVPVATLPGVDCPASSGSCILGAAESNQLVFDALDPEHGPGRELYRSGFPAANDFSSKISPDGSTIAISSNDQLHGKIRFIDLARRQEHDAALSEGIDIFALDWTADGKALLASATQTGQNMIVRIELDGKVTTLANFGVHQVFWIASSPDGRHLAFSQRTQENNVWLVDNLPRQP